MKKRILSAFVCLTLLMANVVGCAETEPVSQPSADKALPAGEGGDSDYDDPFAPESRTDLRFSEIAYVRYEKMDAFTDAVNRMEELCEEEDAFEEIKACYGFLYDELLRIDTNVVVSSIRYNMDVQNQELSEEYEYSTALSTEAYHLFERAVQKVLDSQYSEAFTSLIGPDAAESCDSGVEDYQRLTELMNRESELCIEYEQLAMREYTAEYGGRTWSFDDLNRASYLSYEEYIAILNRLYAEKNAAVGEIYLELTEIRRELAGLYGYDSYADYCYSEIYGRDYSPGEAEAFHSYVKEYVVPAYLHIEEKVFDGLSDAVVNTEEIKPILEEYIPQISAEMAEILDYMSEHEMYYLTDDLDKSMDTGFVTMISEYGQPYLYNAVYGNQKSVTDTLHEFGHYCDYYQNMPYGVFVPEGSYDLAEICSSGLEMLFYAYYDQIFADVSEDVKISLLYSALQVIVEGAMFDEAQQRIFAAEHELTLEEVNEIFRAVAGEYGIDADYDPGLDWVDVNHTFTQPFYYISYSAAYSASLEIWLTAEQEGHEAAKKLYLDILSHGSFGNRYFDVLGACGMEGFLSEDYIRRMSEAVAAEVEKLASENGSAEGKTAA